MNVEKRPKSLPRTQALAAVGQCRLMSLWESLFAQLQQPIAQVLLTRNDIADQTQYINAQNTFTELLGMGVIPIVNENDTLAVSEIRQLEKFGDNDTLSAITAAMVHADYLFLMTDVDCLYDKNPRTNPDAQAIEVVEDVASLEADVSSAGSSIGTGGMSTKIVAARLATSAGVTTVITRSSSPGNIVNILNYVQSMKQQGHRKTPSLPATPPEDPPSLSHSISSFHIDAVSNPPLHTRFLPDPFPIRDRSFWLLHGLAPHGTLYIDAGAHRALVAKAGLYAAGIVDVEGQFAQQEAVRLVVVQGKGPGWSSAAYENGLNSGGVPIDTGPAEVGRALVNYSAVEVIRIKGMKSTEIEKVLGYADSEYVALRENVSLTRREKSSRLVTPAPVVDAGRAN